MFLLDSTPPPLSELASLGSAGLMGAMWLWERRTNRQRDQQLEQAHTRILADRVALDQLIHVVRNNIEAVTRLCATQEQLVRKLERETP
jgi:hypothetical protein